MENAKPTFNGVRDDRSENIRLKQFKFNDSHTKYSKKYILSSEHVKDIL